MIKSCWKAGSIWRITSDIVFKKIRSLLLQCQFHGQNLLCSLHMQIRRNALSLGNVLDLDTCLQQLDCPSLFLTSAGFVFCYSPKTFKPGHRHSLSLNTWAESTLNRPSLQIQAPYLPNLVIGYFSESFRAQSNDYVYDEQNIVWSMTAKMTETLKLQPKLSKVLPEIMRRYEDGRALFRLHPLLDGHRRHGTGISANITRLK